MATPQMSDITTEGIRVGATAFFLPEQSRPEEDRYLFGYRILIVNDSDETVQLLRRHWMIIDADGKSEEVRGPGVVGQKPILEPGKAFKYTSYCPLTTDWGSMEGEYEFQMVDTGELFEVQIGRFFLHPPIPEEIETGV